MLLRNSTLIYILFLMMSLDFSSDSIIRIFPIDFSSITLISQLSISLVMLFFIFSFGMRIPRSIFFIGPFLLIMSVIIFGLVHGMIANNPFDAVNEAIPYLFFISFLGFAAIKEPISISDLERFLRVLVYIVFFKVIIYSFAAYLYYGAISWKVLLKQSPMLLIPLSVYFSQIKHQMQTRQTYFLLFLALVGVIFAMARMLFLSLIFLLFINFLNKNLFRSLPTILFFSFIFIFYIIATGGTAALVSSFLYGGDVYEGGMSYRLEQLQVLIERFQSSPFLGVGFGYFTPGYETYGDLSKPYLLELDILNFISKIGMIATLFYTCAYLWIFYLIKKISDIYVRKISLALFYALLSLLIYSLGQTGHQSYIYWTYLSFLYGFIVSHLRAQAKV